ncbi:MAG TPA: hypothetical protein V6D28_25995 [Leptolyngbyaceae cyanobacterium]
MDGEFCFMQKLNGLERLRKLNMIFNGNSLSVGRYHKRSVLSNQKPHIPAKSFEGRIKAWALGWHSRIVKVQLVGSQDMASVNTVQASLYRRSLVSADVKSKLRRTSVRSLLAITM